MRARLMGMGVTGNRSISNHIAEAGTAGAGPPAAEAVRAAGGHSKSHRRGVRGCEGVLLASQSS